MIKISLREFSHLPEEIILRWLEVYKLVEVKDDHDRVILTDTQSMILTWYGLTVHRMYYHHKYSINEVIKVFNPGEPLTVSDDNILARPLNNFLPIVMRDMKDPKETDRIKMAIHIWQGKVNNALTAMTERFPISVSIDDVLRVMDDPGIVEIKRKVDSGEITIDEGELEFIDYVGNSHTLDDAYFAILCRIGGTSYNQGYQTIISRGATFDLNKSIFPNAITDAFANGLVNLADSLSERNSAGISLITNGKALQNAEWFHRKTHLYTSIIRGFNHFGDCNTSYPVPIKVSSRELLSAFIGKYAVDPETGKTELIDQEWMKHIKIGDVFYMRSMAFCEEHDPSNPCGVCAGQLKSTFPYNAVMQMDCNIGMYSGTAICKPIGQGMLSVKHILKHTSATPFTVRLIDKDYIGTNGDDIFLHEDYCDPGTKLILSSGVIKELTDIRSLDSLDSLTLDKLSYFDEASLSFVTEDIMVGGKTIFQRSVKTSIPSRAARMSRDLLEHIYTNGWETIDKKFISVDLSNWSPTAPIFTLPYTHEDMDVHRRGVESFLMFGKRNQQWKETPVTPERFGEVLTEFWEILNHKFKKINIFHCELLLHSLLAKDPKHGYYGLVSGGGTKYFTSFQSAIFNRGFGTELIFDHQQVLLDDFRTFLVKQRPAGPLECYYQHAVRA